jgi:hypothetical protein
MAKRRRYDAIFVLFVEREMDMVLNISGI